MKIKLARVRKSKLFVLMCDSCGKGYVVKRNNGAEPGDVFTCFCGHETTIKTIHNGFGDCPNCGTVFYSMGIINEAKEYTCRNCKSPIDLVRKSDGSFTSVHNLKC